MGPENGLPAWGAAAIVVVTLVLALALFPSAQKPSGSDAKIADQFPNDQFPSTYKPLPSHTPLIRSATILTGRDHALAAITRNPAQAWGVADSYGTLDAGKDADVVVWDGDPLNLSAPTRVFIKGIDIPLVSRQTLLRDRYRDLKRKYPPFSYR